MSVIVFHRVIGEAARCHHLRRRRIKILATDYLGRPARANKYPLDPLFFSAFQRIAPSFETLAERERWLTAGGGLASLN